MKYSDPPQLDDPFAARLRADAAELRRSPSPDFTTRVRDALLVSPRERSGLRSRAFLPAQASAALAAAALAAAALVLTLGFATWSKPEPHETTTGGQVTAEPRVIEIAHPRSWGALLCDSYSEGVQGRLESELDGVVGDMGRLARGLVARLPSGWRSRVGLEK